MPLDRVDVGHDALMGPAETRGLPDFAHVHRELKRKGVTLFLLWEEYKAAQPEGFGYSWFCQHYRAFAGKVDVVMRQTPPGRRDGLRRLRR